MCMVAWPGNEPLTVVCGLGMRLSCILHSTPQDVRKKVRKKATPQSGLAKVWL